jgi:hypothetical protein
MYYEPYYLVFGSPLKVQYVMTIHNLFMKFTIDVIIPYRVL